VLLCGLCHGTMHNVSRTQVLGTLTPEGLAPAGAAGVRLGAPRTASRNPHAMASQASSWTSSWASVSRVIE
jgi:hypothetical protein